MFKSSNRYEILNTNVRIDNVYSNDMDQSNQDGMQNKDQQIKIHFKKFMLKLFILLLY